MKIAKNFLQILKNWGTETPQQTIISTSGHSLWLFKRLCSGPKTTDDIGPRKSYVQMNFQVSFSYLLNCTFLNYGFVDVYGMILWHDEDVERSFGMMRMETSQEFLLPFLARNTLTASMALTAIKQQKSNRESRWKKKL